MSDLEGERRRRAAQVLAMALKMAGHGQTDDQRRERVVQEIERTVADPEFKESLLGASDPWARRSAGMRCRTCMWFVEKTPNQEGRAQIEMERRAGETRLHRIGRCRRHAPTLSGFPAVYGNDWCGDHKLDEAKA